MNDINRQFRLAARPEGKVKTSDLQLVESAVPEPSDNEVLIQNEYFSLDPSMKGHMENRSDYRAPLQIGDVMAGRTVGTIIASNNPDYAIGSQVFGFFGMQDYALSNGESIPFHIYDVPVNPEAALGVLGGTGMTAYFGLLRLGDPKPGQLLVVSGAAGATGNVAGQIGKIKGCRVIGIAGSPDKCQMLTDELGFEAAINYKTENVAESLSRLCPEGMNIYFDNVGGQILDDSPDHLAMNARVVICGGISHYNLTTKPPGPSNYFNLVFKRAKMEGFILSDYSADFDEARAELRSWYESGKLKQITTVTNGFTELPSALIRLFDGRNTGKMVVRNEKFV